MNSYPKYKAPGPIEIENRVWPTRRLTAPPIWVPVDLRDGNQAFARPMNVETKLRYFRMLCEMGFREIEVAYPAASTEEFEFVRRLIGDGQIPDGVRINVLTAARQDLIERTIQAIAGVRAATVHCYIATSELHGRFVLGKTPEELMRTAVEGTRMIAEQVEAAGMRDQVRYEFSPEEFSDSDLGFVTELAEAVREVWRPRDKRDFVLNLPATVERRAPYEYADMIEAFLRRYSGADHTTISVHTHNDQGCAVAAAEMAVLAGAERVEGTLCGHGERTGNMDLVTFALNLKSRGIEPGIDFSRLPDMVRFIEEASGIRLSPRAPYTGELVFTAFSGTHQDAIRKGMARREEIAEFFGQGWKMPYLHIDPADLGRSYDGLIRINSQSGKGGVAYVLEYVYGIRLPKEMQPMVAFAVQREAETTGRELTPAEVYRIFREKILEPAGAAIRLEGFRIQRPVPGEPDKTGVELELKSRGVLYAVSGVGGGPIEAATAALHKCGAIPEFQLEEYSEHALGRGATAQAAAYVGIRDNSGRMIYGAGIDRNINLAAIRAIVNAINHTLEE
ncbi:2-isopropylmalate synthase [uncultured Victivallis sp.]|uniref:2-isopropylmalate synthase n=1 Tax=uncultured Victivallis sp. TaxID=354118 RepID=UPI0025F89D42|nr:2-isopropylmalate synthase [uncultured Victivallis sp.]